MRKRTSKYRRRSVEVPSAVSGWPPSETELYVSLEWVRLEQNSPRKTQPDIVVLDRKAMELLVKLWSEVQ